MNGVSSKVAAGGAAGALSIVLVWIASLFGLVIPDFVAQALTVLISVVVGWVVPETRSIPLEQVEIKQVVAESKEPSSL